MTAKKPPLSAPELAAEMEIDAKLLRRFLRENASFNNPGSGGRYKFTTSEAASVKKAFTKWNARRSARQTSAGASKSSTSKTTSAKARVDALETSLRTTGKHISQHAE